MYVCVHIYILTRNSGWVGLWSPKLQQGRYHRTKVGDYSCFFNWPWSHLFIYLFIFPLWGWCAHIVTAKTLQKMLINWKVNHASVYLTGSGLLLPLTNQHMLKGFWMYRYGTTGFGFLSQAFWNPPCPMVAFFDLPEEMSHRRTPQSVLWHHRI